jgi:Zn-finger nucleic acid-binding protein
MNNRQEGFINGLLRENQEREFTKFIITGQASLFMELFDFSTMEDNMKCPYCFKEMKVTKKFGTELEACKNCKGVWVDKNDRRAIVRNAQEKDVTIPQRRKDSERFTNFTQQISFIGEVLD